MRRGWLAVWTVLLSGAAAAGTDGDRWIHIRVDESRGERASVDVQLPLTMLSGLLPVLQARVDRETIRIDQGDISLDELRGYWVAVRASKDGEYVTVRDRDNRVRISKIAGVVHVDVDDKDEREGRVRIRVPAAVVDAVLAHGKTVDLGAIGKALEKAPDGELIRVEDGEDEVRIWIDGAPAAAREDRR